MPLSFRHTVHAATVFDQLHDPNVVAFLDGLAILAGAPPGAVTENATLINSFTSERRSREEEVGSFRFPAGFTYCGAVMLYRPDASVKNGLPGVQSQTGEAHIGLWTSATQVGWYLYAHRHGGVGGPREWIHRDFAIVLVRTDRHAQYVRRRLCHSNDEHTIFADPTSRRPGDAVPMRDEVDLAALLR